MRTLTGSPPKAGPVGRRRRPLAPSRQVDAPRTNAAQTFPPSAIPVSSRRATAREVNARARRVEARRRDPLLAPCDSLAAFTSNPHGADPVSPPGEPATPAHVATSSRVELPTDSFSGSPPWCATALLPGPGRALATEAATHGESNDTVQRPHVAVP
jgi:hypothetical protein